MRAPMRMVPPSPVMARPTSSGATCSAVKAWRASPQTFSAGARSRAEAMNAARATGPPRMSAMIARISVAEAKTVASSIARRSPMRSMRRPAETVETSPMAPAPATARAATEPEAPRCIAATTCTGTVAPAATPSSVEGA